MQLLTWGKGPRSFVQQWISLWWDWYQIWGLNSFFFPNVGGVFLDAILPGFRRGWFGQAFPSYLLQCTFFLFSYWNRHTKTVVSSLVSMALLLIINFFLKFFKPINLLFKVYKLVKVVWHVWNCWNCCLCGEMIAITFYSAAILLPIALFILYVWYIQMFIFAGFFCLFVFVNLKCKVTQRKGAWEIFHSLFHSPDVHKSQSWAKWESQELGSPSGSPALMAGTQVLDWLSAAS